MKIIKHLAKRRINLIDLIGVGIAGQAYRDGYPTFAVAAFVLMIIVSLIAERLVRAQEGKTHV